MMIGQKCQLRMTLVTKITMDVCVNPRSLAAGIGFGGLTAGAQRVADVARHISRISPTST